MSNKRLSSLLLLISLKGYFLWSISPEELYNNSQNLYFRIGFEKGKHMQLYLHTYQWKLRMVSTKHEASSFQGGPFCFHPMLQMRKLRWPCPRTLQVHPHTGHPTQSSPWQQPLRSEKQLDSQTEKKLKTTEHCYFFFFLSAELAKQLRIFRRKGWALD